MRIFAYVGLCCVALCGCAGAYDGRAVPAAYSAEQLALARCDNSALTTAAARMSCIIEADRQFSVAIKLRDMSLFDNYAGRLTILGADIDADKVSGQMALDQFKGIREDFGASIDQEANIAAAQNAALAGAVAGMAQNMAAQQQAAQAAAAAAYRPPMNCTSYKLGNTVQTNCN